MMKPDSTECSQLQALLAADGDAANTIELENRIGQHLAACPLCAAREQALTLLIASYRYAEPRPNAKLEHSLLKQMCGRQSG